MQSVNDIRSTFLEFFKRHGHEIRPSSSLVPLNDPTLMFTNAGMNQFKNVFTGAEKLPFSRATTSQKCVRAGGKHNDLDNVGYTARHHTFFEMLGNFSFGDYFKEEAINLAWELLTKDYGLNKDRLCVTVYHDDDVAWNHWKKVTGFEDHRIIRIATNDNFWAMGDTGPCGPCSEIFYDHGAHIPGGPPGTADADGDRFVEIWNLVFMQYEQKDPSTRISLPKPSIDTGMGLERLAAVMQGVTDNYDIDLFQNLITNIKQQASTIGGKPAQESAAYKVIADHLRSSCFLIADGVLPSNEGRGYVLRRIMRRGMRYAHQLGCNDPLMYKLVPALVKEMGEQYSELKRAEASITDNLRQEEERFKQTLERGLKLLEEESASLSKGQKLSGDAAFKLYDTYGFPLDLTQDILRSRGMEVDTDAFEKAMEGQRDMARAAHKGSGDVATGKIWFELKEKLGATKFLGYEKDDAAVESKVLALIKNGEQVNDLVDGDVGAVLVAETPFYAESGGQVGDTGKINNGAAFIEVVGTSKANDLHIHEVRVENGTLSVGDKVTLKINDANRASIRSNHSATHLLHKALRDALGDHVTQKGSLVAPDKLRFDFSHSKGVTKEEIAAIEKTVNEVIWRNSAVETQEMSPEDAIAKGAMALFGEKYGDKVRVLSMGVSVSDDVGKNTPTPYSIELCGGTHVKNTGDIGLFKITSEGSVASGIRRIEAVTGEGVRDYFVSELQKQFEQLQKLESDNAALLADLTKAGNNANKAKPAHAFNVATIKSAELKALPALFEKETAAMEARSSELQDENKKLSKQLAELKKQAALADSGPVVAQKIGSTNFYQKAFDGLEPKELRPVAEGFLKQIAPGVVAVGSNVEGKASIVIAVSPELSSQFNAADLVKTAVEAVGGKGGGGKPEMAQGGGPDASKLDAALTAVQNLLK